MLPIVTGALVTRHLAASEFLGPNAVYKQLIRWRKPLWLGTAKSKIFRVPKKPKIPVADFEEIKRLNNEYRTYRESIRRYFMNVSAENEIQFDEETVRQAAEEDYERCFKLNEEWNRNMAKSREAREAAELEARKEQVLKNIMAREERQKILMEEVDDRVRKAKAEASSFITEANIDQAIEEALGNVVNYNVAIDSEGNRYEGEYVPPPKVLPTRRRLQAEQ